MKPTLNVYALPKLVEQKELAGGKSLDPQHRLRTTENSWMEVRSYRMDGEPAWKHKEPVSELDGLQLDGPAVPAAGSQVPRELKGLTCVPSAEGLEFIDPHTGAFMSTQLEGFTLAAMAFPSGKALWADETATVCYGEPVEWQGNTVFLLRRLSQGLTGHLALTELRIYSPEAELLAALTR
jgi:hypothetical protein